jgi:hypothetical protein
MILQERERKDALWRSALIPGFGQYYKGQHVKAGLFFGAASLVAGTNLYLYFIKRPSLKDDRDHVLRSMRSVTPGSSEYSRLENKYNNARSSLNANKNLILGGSALFAGIWALNIIDSSLGFPVTIRRTVNSGTIRGEFGPRFSQGNSALGFHLQFDF